MGTEATSYLEKYGLNNVHDAIVVDQSLSSLGVILMEEGEPDWSTSLNAYMLAEGLAEIDPYALNDESTPDEVISWQEY